MDIKEFKQNVINDIKTKLVTFFEHPEFKKHLYKVSRESNRYRGDVSFEDFVRNNPRTIIHFPLTILLDETHEYYKRYVHQLITLNMRYYSKDAIDNNDIRNYIDIVSDTYNTATNLAKRPLETLLCMNMAIKTYNEIINFKSNRERDYLVKFSKNSYFSQLNRIFKVVADPIISPTHKEILIDVMSINVCPTSSNFGRFEKSVEHKRYAYDAIKSSVKFLTKEEVRNEIISAITRQIDRSKTNYKSLESQLDRLGDVISDLEMRKREVDSLSF